ncbi:MAG: hypothetical protein WC052_04720 [Patescibacteria group bacterium]|jgi:hypothetical protein
MTTKTKAQPLTDADFELLKRREEVKAELKRLDEHLKPRITATIDAHGTGKAKISHHEVELKRSVRNTVSWKSLCASLVPEDVILSTQPDFTEEYNVDSVEVLS